MWTAADEFEFLPNPFFENQVLKREFVFSGRIPESLSASPVSEQGTELVWKPGMDLTRRPSPVKQIPGEGKPAASFFCLFSPGIITRVCDNSSCRLTLART